MKFIHHILIAFCLFLCSCDKDLGGVTTNAAVATTGAGGSLARFAIVGNFMYTVDEHKLKVFDITNPADPVHRSTNEVGFQIETIYPFKDKLFIGSATVIYIYSIADPANPTRLSTAISPQVMRRCDPVVAKDTVAFATLRTNGACGGTQSILAVFDIKDIARPVQKASYNVNEPYGLGYQGDALYVCDKVQGLIVFDISNPYQPTFIKSIRDGSYIDVIPYQNTLICWVATGIILYDITDNKNPIRIATII